MDVFPPPDAQTVAQPPVESQVDGLLGQLLAPVDSASLCFFRIGFGTIMAWWAWDYLTSGHVRFLYIEPRFHFTYYLFDWVRPWTGVGMYLHFFALTLLALTIAFGFWYRLTTLLFAGGFTYVFLLDATNYQNHYYLIILLSWLLPLLPLHRAVSYDAAVRRGLRSQIAPAWALWLLRFQIALPYVFGGVAKLNADWLAGEPVRQMLAAQATLPVLGPLLRQEWVVVLFVWSGLLFDLGIVPLLLWRPSRGWAYVLCLFFHVANSVLFQIHIFPWFMIFATTLFFEPDWPRRVLGGSRLALPAPQNVAWRSLALTTRWGFAILLGWCVFQVLWPLRLHLYPGNASWTERGHCFAWRMMLRGKTAGVRYYVTDPKTGETWHPDLRPYLNVDQAGRFTRDPEMILHLAHFLAAEHRRQTGREVEVRALVLTSLNGRKPELFIDPDIDLAKEPRGFYHRPWVRPQTEPLRAEPWTVPLVEWEKHIELPPLPIVRHDSRRPPSHQEP